jgi:DNA-binding MarR family transcriptional regulator
MALLYTNLAMFVVLVVASYIFYQRIKMAQMEYDESRGTVQNITSMFTRQVKRMESDINRVEREALQAKYMANNAISAGQGSGDATLVGLEKVKELNNRVENIETSIESMRDDLKKLASQSRVISQVQPLNAPIPVEGSNIIQQITETEMDVLKMIVDLGEGTVPEIKDVIGKTREHTARLLKKLYEKGYIDRNTSGMPYRYSIRKEIRELILEQNEEPTLGL